MRRLAALALGLLCAAAAIRPGPADAAPDAGRAAPALRLTATAALAATPSGGISHGTLRLASLVGPRGERAQVASDVADLDVTRDGTGAIPHFRLVLVPAAGAEADLGALRVDARGSGRFRAADARAALGGRTLRDFEGGVAEIRRGATAVLTAPVARLALAGAGTSETSRRVWGDFAAVDRPRPSPGAWSLESVVDGAGAHRDRIFLSSRLLETDGAPDYRAYLVDRTGRTVNLGPLRRERRLGAWFAANQARAALPGGIATVEEFDEGRVEVRLGGSTVLLRGFAPPFPDLTHRPLPQRSAAARGAEELSPPGGGAARALAEARMAVSETRRVQTFTLRALGLPAAAGPYAVVARDDSGTVTPLGVFAASGPLGAGRLSVSTARGGALPGGLPWLSRQTLEVRDAAAAVVLTGAFPTIR